MGISFVVFDPGNEAAAGVLDVDQGFRVDHLLAVELVRRGGADKTAQIFFAEAVNRVQNLPGVESASAVMCAPLTGTRWTSPYQVEGQPAASPSELPQTVLNMAAPDYFQTIQARQIEGRYLNEADSSVSGAGASA